MDGEKSEARRLLGNDQMKRFVVISQMTSRGPEYRIYDQAIGATLEGSFETQKWAETHAEMMEEKMPGLRNSNINMEIGYCTAGKQKKLYVQVGHERQYYGTLMSAKADKFLKMLEKWDEAGGNDNGED